MLCVLNKPFMLTVVMRGVVTPLKVLKNLQFFKGNENQLEIATLNCLEMIHCMSSEPNIFFTFD
jgi:hypothetical protein